MSGGGTAHALISSACVNACAFCAASQQRREGRFARREDVLAFLRSAAADGVQHVVFSGIGEPTLDRHFDEYLGVAQGLGFRTIGLFSNGFGCTQERVRRWRSLGLDRVLLSVHGLEAGHDRLVGRSGSFSEAIGAISTYAGESVRVNVNTCLTRWNLHEVVGLRDRLTELPVDRQTLAFLEWSGSVSSHSEIVPDYEEIGARAAEFVPEGNRRTRFDNIPACIVGRKTREESEGIQGVRLLDGARDVRIVPSHRKVWPDACVAQPCALRCSCPGFERGYVEARGWQGVPRLVEQFLSGQVPSAELRADLTPAGAPARRRPAGRRQHLRPAPAPRIVILRVGQRPEAAVPTPSGHDSRGNGTFPATDSERHLRAVVRGVLDGDDRWDVRFVWTGDDPLLLAPELFGHAIEESRARKGLSVSHVVHTDMSRLDARWADMLRRTGCVLSTGLDPFRPDGQEAIGSPAHQEWVARVALALDLGLDLHLSLPLAPWHREREEHVYRFLCGLESLASRPVPCSLGGVGRSPSVSTAPRGEARLGPEDYARLVVRVARVWEDEGRPFPLVPVDDWLRYPAPPRETETPPVTVFDLAEDGGAVPRPATGGGGERRTRGAPAGSRAAGKRGGSEDGNDAGPAPTTCARGCAVWWAGSEPQAHYRARRAFERAWSAQTEQSMEEGGSHDS